MARMGGAHSTADTPPEIAHTSAGPEPSPPDLGSPADEEAEFEPTELPSFHPLPRGHRWRNRTSQASPVHEAPVERAPATQGRQGSWIGRKAPRPTLAESRAETNEEDIAPYHSRRSSWHGRFFGLACLFVLSMGAGVGVAYLAQSPEVIGGSYMQHVRAAMSFIATAIDWRAAPTSDRADRARTVGGVVIGSSAPSGQQVDAVEGGRRDAIGAKLSHGEAADPLKSSDPRNRSDGQALPRGPEDRGGTDASNAGLPLLVEQMEQQIASRQLEQPIGDNALETYRRIIALSPQHPAATFVGEHLSSAFWSLAMDAKAAERWDDAVHYLDILNTLPPVPAAAIMARSARPPARPARDRQGESAQPPQPAEAEAVGRSEDVSNPGATAEKSGLSDRPRALATPSSTNDVSQAIGPLAISRGDAAMRLGDVVAARRFYQVSASAGVAGAANALARSYDPIYLRQIGVRGLQADAETAKRWYEKAIEEGDTEARAGLKRLMREIK